MDAIYKSKLFHGLEAETAKVQDLGIGLQTKINRIQK